MFESGVLDQRTCEADALTSQPVTIVDQKYKHPHICQKNRNK